MLKGRTALVTGSTQGLGLAIANRLAREGCNLVLSGLGEVSTIETTRQKLAAEHGVRAVHSAADLAHPLQIEAMIRDATAEFGTVDILVNNAVVRHFSPIEAFRPEDWDRALAVNLSAAFHTTRSVVPGMRSRGFSRIVNVSSVYGLFATVNRVDYVTTKTALIGFTRAVALETAQDGITCNAICPGTSPTPAIEQRLAGVMAAEGLSREAAERAYLATRQPTGRFIALENAAALVAFLCGPAGADITGATLPIDGGWSAA